MVFVDEPFQELIIDKYYFSFFFETYHVGFRYFSRGPHGESPLVTEGQFRVLDNDLDYVADELFAGPDLLRLHDGRSNQK